MKKSSRKTGTQSVLHPLTRKKIPLHRYVIECYLGRELSPDEVVHHIDENPKNNFINNLKIVSHIQHRNLHRNQKIIAAGGDPNIHKFCTICREIKMKEEFPKNKKSGDGYGGVCKECVALIRINMKGIKPKALSKKGKNYKKYQQTEKYKEYQKRYQKEYRKSKKYLEKLEIYKAARNKKEREAYKIIKQRLSAN